jgi:hypothetical protein
MRIVPARLIYGLISSAAMIERSEAESLQMICEATGDLIILLENFRLASLDCRVSDPLNP